MEYKSEIGLQLWKNLDDNMGIKRTWESIKENNKTLPKESLGYYEVVLYKPCFDSDYHNFLNKWKNYFCQLLNI
jgi:hypothetical protein